MWLAGVIGLGFLALWSASEVRDLRLRKRALPADLQWAEFVVPDIAGVNCPGSYVRCGDVVVSVTETVFGWWVHEERLSDGPSEQRWSRRNRFHLTRAGAVARVACIHRGCVD